MTEQGVKQMVHGPQRVLEQFMNKMRPPSPLQEDLKNVPPVIWAKDISNCSG